MSAISTYLRVLREEQKLTQAKAAAQAGVSSKTLERWERGVNEPSVSSLAQLIPILQGSIEDALHLLVNPHATAVDGEHVARQWLQQAQRQQTTDKAKNITSPRSITSVDQTQLEKVIERLRAESLSDPALPDVIMAFLEGRRSSQ